MGVQPGLELVDDLAIVAVDDERGRILFPGRWRSPAAAFAVSDPSRDAIIAIAITRHPSSLLLKLMAHGRPKRVARLEFRDRSREIVS